MQQQSLFGEKPLGMIADDRGKRRRARSGTYADNMGLPVHRWFRFSAGYSGEWVQEVLTEHAKLNRKLRVLDPFAGSGTTLLAADSCKLPSTGYEAQPFICRIAAAKIGWDTDPVLLRTKADALVGLARRRRVSVERLSVPLLSKCYTPEAFAQLESLRLAYTELCGANTDNVSRLLWLVLISILRECSHVGTAQWQYVLPSKSKAKATEPYRAFGHKALQMIGDILQVKRKGWRSRASLINTDAREPKSDSGTYDVVITSPPYPNNYDYADATRLEMTFWGEVRDWGDLHTVARQYLIRSCSQHSAKERLRLSSILPSPLLAPIVEELTDACNRLAELRQTKGGKKTYHTMAAAYFLDLATILHTLRNRVRAGGRMCFVVGDSAPYGVHLPVDRWLGELAIAAGFRAWNFEKLRDRNIKWKNRTHTVPLREGRLWIEG